MRSTSIVCPTGEGSKSYSEFARVADALIEARIERRDVVIALGGGVVGDLAGFCAATLRRGVRLVQIPTTLLAQVDSSVGGKTGINSRHGKNLVGAFHQPSLVLADTTCLNSLSEREFRAGFAEVVKYGLLGESQLLRVFGIELARPVRRRTLPRRSDRDQLHGQGARRGRRRNGTRPSARCSTLGTLSATPWKS